MSGKRATVSGGEGRRYDSDKVAAGGLAGQVVTPGPAGGLREELGRALAENARLRAEQARCEEKLQECNECFRTVLDQSIDVVYRRNLKKDCYDYISPAIEAISGFSVEEFSRIPSSELLGYIHPDDHAVVLKRFEQFEQSRHGAKTKGFFEFRLKCKQGGFRWISDSGVLVAASDGTPLYHVGVARDITERKRIEESLKHSNEELEKTVAERTARLRRLTSELSLAEQRERKRLSDFLHDDLQQVLVAAKLESEKLAIGQLSAAAMEGTRKLHDLVMEALNKTRSIVNELVTPLIYVVGFVPALRQLVEQMGQRHDLRIALDVQGAPDALPESVRIRLFHSVRELLFNVAKHAGKDTASVSVMLSEGQVEVTVSDTGTGFDPEAVLSGNAQETAGYGLYSISERMAAMGGRMSVVSAPGCGTRVTLSVPSSSDLCPVPQPSASRARPGDRRAEADGRARVLVADDHDVVRCGIISLLSLEPSLDVVGQAKNGREALDLTRQLRPDVVVMDIRMPEMDGIEATRLIKAEFPDTIVIGVSAFVEAGFQTAMLEAGAVELLDKVVAGDKLLPTIARHLAARAT